MCRMVLVVLGMNQVCSYLGGQLENYCIEFLAEYTDDIIDMLVTWRRVVMIQFGGCHVTIQNGADDNESDW